MQNPAYILRKGEKMVDLVILLLGEFQNCWMDDLGKIVGAWRKGSTNSIEGAQSFLGMNPCYCN